MTISALLRQHLSRYPAMQPQDVGKLLYQRTFGPEHMISDASSVLPWIDREWQLAGETPLVSEPIGNGLCRYHLSRTAYAPAAARLLAELFCRTAQETAGSQAQLASALSEAASLPMPGLCEWLEGYRAAGCPAVHHSDAFRAAYVPHYRLLRAEYANFFPVLRLADEMTRSAKPQILAIDGRCGSGKSYLADLIARLLPEVRVVHMDDFYLPMPSRAANWAEIPAGNMDLERFRHEVLEPAMQGEPIDYRAFDCASGSLRPAVRLEPARLTVVEGSYSHHPLLRGCCDATVFLTCDPAEQRRRLRVREGAYFAMFETRWMPMEERYHAAFAVAAQCDLLLDTTAFLEE